MGNIKVRFKSHGRKVVTEINRNEYQVGELLCEFINIGVGTFENKCDKFKEKWHANFESQDGNWNESFSGFDYLREVTRSLCCVGKGSVLEKYPCLQIGAYSEGFERYFDDVDDAYEPFTSDKYFATDDSEGLRKIRSTIEKGLKEDPSNPHREAALQDYREWLKDIKIAQYKPMRPDVDFRRLRSFYSQSKNHRHFVGVIETVMKREGITLDLKRLDEMLLAISNRNLLNDFLREININGADFLIRLYETEIFSEETINPELLREFLIHLIVDCHLSIFPDDIMQIIKNNDTEVIADYFRDFQQKVYDRTMALKFEEIIDSKSLRRIFIKRRLFNFFSIEEICCFELLFLVGKGRFVKECVLPGCYNYFVVHSIISGKEKTKSFKVCYCPYHRINKVIKVTDWRKNRKRKADAPPVPSENVFLHKPAKSPTEPQKGQT